MQFGGCSRYRVGPNLGTQILILLAVWLAIVTSVPAQEAVAAGAAGGTKAATAPPDQTPEKLPMVFEEVTVTATRVSEELKDVPQAVTVVTEDSIQGRFARTPTSYLREQAGIFAPQVSATSSPIIRGSMGTTRVLYMWDGIRLNNAQTRSGPSEGMNQIPDVAVSRMELIRGPGSVQYGTDAMGGVINVITPRAEGFSQKLSFGGELRGVYNSNDEGRTTDAVLWMSTRRFSVSAGGTTRDEGSYRTPDALLSNTGYDANGGYIDTTLSINPQQLVRASWISNRRGNVETYTQSKVNPSGIPRVFNPWELRGLAKLDYTNGNFLSSNNEVRGYAYDQYYLMGRDNPITESTKTISRTRQDSDQTIYGGGVQDTFRVGAHRFVTGVDFRTEHLTSDKILSTFTKATGVTVLSVPNGNVPPGHYDVVDMFGVGTFRISSRLTTTVGTRLESVNLLSHPRPEDALKPFTVADLTMDKRWNSATWNAGAIYNLVGHWSLVGNVATTFRAPSFMDTLSTSVPTFASGQASVPSPNVKPEHGITYEVGPRYAGRIFEFSLTAYTNQLTDVMSSVQNGTINIPGLGVVKAMVNNNIGSGYIRGIEGFASLRFMRHWTVVGNYTYTRGLDTVANVPLRFIPPMFGTLAVHYSGTKDRWWVESSLHAVDRLRHHSPLDESDAGFSMDPGYGSPSKTNPALRPNFQIPGYVVTSLRGGVKVWQAEKRSLELTADLNNLFNVHYREAYAQQQLYAPGFGAALGGRIRF